MDVANMSAIINVGSIYPSVPPVAITASAAKASSTEAAAEAAGSAPGDSVEISPFGQALSQAADQSSLSLARIHAIRSEIENGSFETQQRIDGTVSRLLEFLK